MPKQRAAQQHQAEEETQRQAEKAQRQAEAEQRLQAEENAEEEVKQFVDHTEETDVDDVVNNVFEEKNIIPQSEEVDEYGNHFVLSSDGSFDFGLVDAKSGLQQSPIRLSMGENIVDEDGNNHGYGLLHIEAERGDKIIEAGYKSVQDFVENVAKNYTTIKEGNVIANNQTYLLELVDDHNNTLFIQLSKNGEYWTVNSAGIFRKKYSRNKRKVFDRPAIDPDINTDISGVDSDHSDGVVTPAGNSPNLSTNKGSENAQDNKDYLPKNVEANKQQEEKQKVKHHMATVQNGVSEKEVAVRDAIVDMVRKSRIEVGTNNEDAQRLLDWANDVRLEAKRKSALETASVSLNEKHQQTVISSADGAKVLNNLDKLAKEYDNNAYPKEKTFLGNVAKALGINEKGSSSQYATFETKNGKVVTIRLSNHNATVSNFDKVGEEEGISIVVSPKENEGILNDGNAHVIEYFYDSIKLRKADGKPLAEIVRSIKQTLYSGEFKDTTGLAKRQEVNNPLQLREHRVYHGSGAEFDAFDHSHMGNEKDAQIVDRIRFFRTPNGEAYGFTVGGKIYIDTRIATAETPIHEYSHLWAQMLREQNPKEWANIVSLMKGTPIWDEIKGIYIELKTDDEIADEVLAHYSGKRGAEKLRAEEAKVKEGNTPLSEKIKAIGAIERVRKALHKFWKGVADTLGIHFTTAEEVADRVMYDLLSGLNPNNVSGKNGETKELIAVHNISDENLSEEGEMYRIREEEPPTKTGIDYKVFFLKNGELYPPMVANNNEKDS